MNWWDEKAARLNERVRASERLDADEYGEIEARRATVHAREDIVMLVSHLSSISAQLRTANRLLLAITVVAVATLYLNH